MHTRLAPFVAELVEVLDFCEEIPYGRHSHADHLVAVREGNDPHRLRKVGIARRADEQPTRLPTRFIGVRPEPWPCPIAGAQRPVVDHGRLGHTALLAALAT